MRPAYLLPIAVLYSSSISCGVCIDVEAACKVIVRVFQLLLDTCSQDPDVDPILGPGCLYMPPAQALLSTSLLETLLSQCTSAPCIAYGSKPDNIIILPA